MDPNKATFLFLVLAAGAGAASAQGDPFLGRDFPTWGHPGSLAIGDLNGDGKPDIALTSAGPNAPLPPVAETYLGNGAGAIVQSYSHALFGGNPIAIAIGEATGDAFLDLAVADALGGAVLFPGDGLGGFGAPTTWAPTLHPTSVAIADLNGDGKVELLGAVQSTNSVFVMLGLGGGAFSAPTTFYGGSIPVAVAVADMDGDGKLDVIVADSASICILLGNGVGGFAPAVTTLTGVDPKSLAIGDFNGDGKPDVATANANSDNVTVKFSTSQ